MTVHGGLDRGGSFARLARRLDDHCVISYDRRGYQGSRSNTPPSLSAHRDDLLAIVHELAHISPVTVVGHSYGGVVALAAAAHNDSDLSGGIVTYEPPLPWILRREGAAHGPLAAPREEAESFFRRMVSDAAWERLSEVEKESRRADGIALVDDLATLRTPTSPIDLTQVQVPVTYSYGDLDGRAEYYREVGAVLGTLCAEVNVVPMLNAGHGAHLSNPESFARIILEHERSLCV